MGGQLLAGKVAVVTGAGRGVGRAYARALAAAGAAVVVNDLAEPDGSSSADEVAREIEAAGGRATANHASVTDFAGTRRMLEAAVERYGRLDIAVANAGNMRPTSLEDAAEADWADVLAVHANGTFNTIHHAIPLLRESGGGTILTTGDITTYQSFPGLAAYRSSKAAIAVLTLHAAEELRELDINVNSIMPAATETRMSQQYLGSLTEKHPNYLAEMRARNEREKTGASGPMAPDEIPPLGVFLCSDGARRITGRLFQAHGLTIRLVAPNDEILSLRSDEGRWTPEAVAAELPAWLDSMEAAVA